MKQEISITQVAQQLRDLGVHPGGVLLVHCAFSTLRPVEGGPAGLVAALRLALGPQGTLVMPSLSDDDGQPFDPCSTSCLGMGVVADSFWRMPGVLRSDSPHAFSAHGPLAAEITAPHPLDVPHGLESPVGRVYDRDGQVLLLGVGHDADTTIHLAEALAPVRYHICKTLNILQDNRVQPFLYYETDHCCQNFALLDGWLEAQALQRRGPVGHAQARLARSQDIVAQALAHLRQDETVFLHPFGVDEECDIARRSLPEYHS